MKLRGSSPLIVLAPVQAAAVESLRATLRALPAGDASPFARVPGLHFGRFVVIDHLEGRPGRPPAVTTPHVLMTTDFDGPLRLHLRALREAMGAELDAIFGRCPGYAAARFERWIAAHRQPAGFSVVACPGATVEQIRHWLGVRRALVRVARHDGDPAALRTAWEAEFGR